jgi:hypothetical protein
MAFTGEFLIKFVELIMSAVIGCIALIMIITGGVLKTQGTGASQQLYSNMGVSGLPIAMIVLGIILELLFVMNCVAICSGDNKCKILKKVLGSVYSIMGVIIIITGYVEGHKLASYAEVGATNATTQCQVFSG